MTDTLPTPTETVPESPVKRGPGRPKGSKTKKRRNNGIPATIGGTLEIADWKIKRDGRKHFVDFTLVERLGSIGCTIEEIALVLGYNETTLRKTPKYRAKFYEAYEAGINRCKMSLRRAQYVKAVEEKNPAMLQWLGKVFLGQREQVDVHQTGETNVNFRGAIASLSVDELRQLAGLASGYIEGEVVPLEDDNAGNS